MTWSEVSSSTGSIWLISSAVFLVAGAVKGLVGLGLPTVAMALLALSMTPAQAAALLIVPSLVTNLWQMRPWPAAARMTLRLARMQLGVVAGTLAGACLLGAAAGSGARAALGAALVAYAVWSLWGKPLVVPPATQRWLGFVIGGLTGWVTAATGVFAIPAVPYLQALGLQRDELMQAMGISFTISTLSLAAGLLLNGQPLAAAAGNSVWLVVPALAGMALGQGLREKVEPLLFKKIFYASLMLLGAHLLLQAR